MTVKNRKPRPLSHGPRQRLSSRAPDAVPQAASFYESLKGCAQAQVNHRSPLQYVSSLFRPRESRSPQTGAGALARAWSWMHAKYALSATKRLRVSESVSLGEKRFVAIVTVEGREFLIGGGASGMSLLAHLGSAPEPVDEFRREFGVGGGAK